MVPAFGKAGKLFSIIPEDGAGDFAVVRNTTASYVGQDRLIRFAAANEPRFDWTNGCPVLLDEDAATNLLLHSSDFSNAAWSKSGVTVTPNDIIAPDGTMTAVKIVFAAANDFIDQFIGTSALQRAHSIWIKGTAGETVSLDDLFVFGPLVTLNGGWQRFDFTSSTGGGIAISSAQGATARTIWLWGAQVELASSASSYISTTASAATRNADVITVTPPAGTSEIVTTFEDGTTQVVTSIPGTFTIPNGRVAKVKMT
jgi:hypothetical protein